MRLSEFNYYLPKKLIAQKPIQPRDHSHLMVLDRKKQKINHHHFFAIDKFFKRGDILVLNETKVFPARLYGKKLTGGKVEILLLRPELRKFQNPLEKNIWRIIDRSRLKTGQKIQFSKNLEAEIIKNLGPEKIIQFNQKGKKLAKLIYQLGKTPTPPYIKPKTQDLTLRKWYQTIYAQEIGSAAAPTAGFHFTKKLMEKLKKQGISFEKIILHIGRATFEPIKEKNLKNYQVPAELAIIDDKTCRNLNQAKKQGRRIIAVGTSTIRALEGFSRNGKIWPGEKFVNLFIYPGYQFQFIDALITNFHLPKSTNLVLVSALAGKKFILKAYQEAVRKKYRFYSFGDASFIF